jgi:hypothetical protein
MVSVSRPAIAGVLTLAIVTAALAFIARAQDAAGLVVLGGLTPVVEGAGVIGRPVVTNIWSFTATAIAGAVSVAMIGLYAQLRRSEPERAMTCAVVGCALLAQASWLWAQPLLGMIFGLCAIASALVRWSAMLTTVSAGGAASVDIVDSGRPRFDWIDVVFVLAISTPAWLFRLYALNTVPDSFEGELAPYYLGATTAAGIPLANAGIEGPWAPLGLLFYPPLLAATNFFGSTLLAVRFTSAAISLWTLLLLYAFTRRWFGRLPAAYAALFYALDPLQIGWGRTDVHPHGVTTWMLIVMSWATLKAHETGGWRWFVVIGGLMALSWHQYPSGQLAPLIPIAFFTFILLQSRPPFTAGGIGRAAILTVGLAGWMSGEAFAQSLGGSGAGLGRYFELMSSRVAWTSSEALPLAGQARTVATQVAASAGDVLAGLFVELRYRFHQDVLMPVHEWPTRSVAWMVAALILAGACLLPLRRLRTPTLVLGCWVLASVLPAILSERAYPKRSAALFPALFILAGIGGSEFLRALTTRSRAWTSSLITFGAIAVAAWMSVTSYLWFWPANVPAGRANELRVRDWVAESMQPGTLIIVDGWHSYAAGKLTYLLSDLLRSPGQTLFYYMIDGRDDDLADALRTPASVTIWAEPGAYYYRWGGLGHMFDQRDVRWAQALVILQMGLKTPEQTRIVRKDLPLQYSDAERLALLARYCQAMPHLLPGERCNDCEYVVARCPISASR